MEKGEEREGSPKDRQLLQLMHAELISKNRLNAAHEIERVGKFFFDMKYVTDLYVEKNDFVKLVDYVAPFLEGNKEKNIVLAEIFKLKYYMHLARKDDANALKCLRTELGSVIGEESLKSFAALIAEASNLPETADFKKFQDNKKDRQAYFKKIRDLLVKALPGIPGVESDSTAPDVNLLAMRLTTLVKGGLCWETLSNDIKEEHEAHMKASLMAVDEDIIQPRAPLVYRGENVPRGMKRKDIDDLVSERNKRARLEKPEPLKVISNGELQKFSDKLPREKLIMFEFENARGVAVAAFHPQVDHLVAVATIPALASQKPTLFLMDVSENALSLGIPHVLAYHEIDLADIPKFMRWSPDGQYLAISFEKSPFFSVFQMEGNKIKQSDDLASFGGKHVEGSIIIGLDLISTPLQNGTESLVLCAASENEIHVYDLANQDLIFKFNVHEGKFTAMCSSRGNPTVLACSTSAGKIEGFPLIKALHSGIAVDCPSGVCTDVRCSPDGERIFMIGEEQDSLLQVDPTKSVMANENIVKMIYTPFVNTSHRKPQLEVVSDIILVGDGNEVKVWYQDSPNMITSLAMQYAVNHMSLSHTGRYMAIWFQSNAFQVNSNAEIAEKYRTVSKKGSDQIIRVRAAVALPSPALVASTANAAQAVVRRGPKKRLFELTEMPQTNEDRIAKLFISADGNDLYYIDRQGVFEGWKIGVMSNVVSHRKPNEKLLKFVPEFALTPEQLEGSLSMAVTDKASHIGVCWGGFQLVSRINRNLIPSYTIKPDNQTSVVTAVAFDNSSTYVATVIGLYNGDLRFRPRLAKDSEFNSYPIHSGPVTDILFLHIDKETRTFASASRDGYVKVNSFTPDTDSGKAKCNHILAYPVAGGKNLRILLSPFLEEGSTWSFIAYSSEEIHVISFPPKKDKEKKLTLPDPDRSAIVHVRLDAAKSRLYVVHQSGAVSAFTYPELKLEWSEVPMEGDTVEAACINPLKSHIALSLTHGKTFIVSVKD